MVREHDFQNPNDVIWLVNMIMNRIPIIESHVFYVLQV